MFFKFLFDLKILLFLLFVLSFISLFVGVSELRLAQIFSSSFDVHGILSLTRLPRTLSIIITGMSLSICGLIMQQLTQNKFVSPTTAGTMDCAKLGILVSMIFFAHLAFIIQVTISSVFAIVGTLIFIQILQKIKLKDMIFVPLIGLMFGGIVSAITTFFAYQLNLIQNINSWLQGDFSNVIQGSYEQVYITLPLLLLAYLFANKITIAGMGEDVALNLGISYKFILNLGLIIVGVITSVIILSVGIIPFLGLIVPNIISIYKGDNLKKNLIYIALFGAVFLLICDIFSRLIIYPFEVPISLVVGIIGSFIFILILFKRKAHA
ncbi:iron ABC transporter permease [Campylobacter sp. MIT 99-7217]|uniref:ABC transporter permease n=1 Tax=Campylobacter sp. MIT 99-7217 TaxID=535091 RepID=UPI001157C428|nr:iron chelate uptake ABC transporter family permease subunit [Campylobacter sp. MIT 99-7217]TQR34523.1 iron ABC transporter permease [Campylobacter sp. MIT 99-7217]